MELNNVQRYPIPAARHQVEEEIRRSRFITTIDFAPSVDRAREIVGEVRQEHPEANHHCWAYVIGVPGSTAQIGLSDAGEPHGTAGRPMLTVLLNAGVGDICAVVTRYFGGTLLGKGGLVRAYSGGVQLALTSLPTKELVPKTSLTINFDYNFVDSLKRILPDFEAEVVSEHYAAKVIYTVQVPNDSLDGLVSAVTNLTNGKAIFSPV